MSVTERKSISDKLPNGAFQRLSGSEAHDTPFRDRDRIAGARVAGDTGPAKRRFERAEADERDRVAFLQRARDAGEQRIDRGSRAGPGDTNILRDLPHQILLVHPYAVFLTVSR